MELKKHKKRNKNSPLKIAKKNCDDAYSRFIRLKNSVDGYCTCFTCGRVKPIKEETQAGHFISSGKLATRFVDMNVHPQCIQCNKYFEGNKVEYEKRLDKEYGKGTADKLLIASKHNTKFTIPEYKIMTAFYNAEVKQMGGGEFWQSI